ncbi:uncharacterized protein N7477_007452 [Penicillium maclennaniae]|uniref:uncharacterized protein n=1 Tax=Penicillium maclennaniae TaxID=1343394 RepID=UPI002541739E|nr:uncharacterized protein N7477_007452 [Penicillium maclennaniae]KAJ5665004.1 hypothetical protein N7477_007452 [Penicillium maclennaniae]
MLVRSILLGGAAMGASAFLVVPEMEPQMEAVEDGFMNISPMLREDTRHALVDLPCTDCPIRRVDKEGAVSWVEGEPSSLMLDFAIEDNRLLANEIEDGEVAGPMSVGYALEVMPVQTPFDEAGADLLDVRFTILDLDTRPVPIDTVAITLVQDSTGELLIAKTEVEESTLPSERKSWKKCQGKPKCLQELLFSRIHGLLAHAKDRMMGKGPGPQAGTPGSRKGCGGKKGLKGLLDIFGNHHGPHKHHDEAGPEGHHRHHDEGETGPEGMFHDLEGPTDHHGHGHFNPEAVDRPRHHMHHGPHHGAFAHTFSRVVRFILVPAILGVLAGLTASAVGMLVGQAVVFLWQRYRGDKPEEHKAAWEQGDACEKQGLMSESENVLPEYIESSSTRASMDKH